MRQLHYTPLSGGLVDYDTSTGQFTNDTTIEQFLQLRRNQKIKYVKTQRQGHPILHGRVDIYKVCK